MFPLTKYALSVTLCCCLNANASLAILQSFPFLYNCTATQYTCSSLIGQLYGLIHSLSDWLYLLWEPHSHTLSDSVIVKTLNWSIRSWQLLTQWLSIHHVILHGPPPPPTPSAYMITVGSSSVRTFSAVRSRQMSPAGAGQQCVQYVEGGREGGRLQHQLQSHCILSTDLTQSVTQYSLTSHCLHFSHNFAFQIETTNIYYNGRIQGEIRENLRWELWRVPQGTSVSQTF